MKKTILNPSIYEIANINMVKDCYCLLFFFFFSVLRETIEPFFSALIAYGSHDVVCKS